MQGVSPAEIGVVAPAQLELRPWPLHFQLVPDGTNNAVMTHEESVKAMKHQSDPNRMVALAIPMPAVTSLALFRHGCQEKPSRSGGSLPAGKGTIKLAKGEDGNTTLTVRVESIAAPSRIATEATVFVVWVHPPYSAARNVGALRLDENLKGEFGTSIPFRRFKVTVTPESSGQVSRPLHEPVLSFDADIVF